MSLWASAFGVYQLLTHSCLRPAFVSPTSGCATIFTCTVRKCLVSCGTHTTWLRAVAITRATPLWLALAVVGGRRWRLGVGVHACCCASGDGTHHKPPPTYVLRPAALLLLRRHIPTVRVSVGAQRVTLCPVSCVRVCGCTFHKCLAVPVLGECGQGWVGSVRDGVAVVGRGQRRGWASQLIALGSLGLEACSLVAVCCHGLECVPGLPTPGAMCQNQCFPLAS